MAPRCGTLKSTVPLETRPPTFACREFGSAELDSIIIRLSAPMATTVPSKKRISAAEPGPVRTVSLFFSAMLASAVTHSKVLNAFTFTVPSMALKCAVGCVITVSVGGGRGGAFLT